MTIVHDASKQIRRNVVLDFMLLYPPDVSHMACAQSRRGASNTSISSSQGVVNGFRNGQGGQKEKGAAPFLFAGIAIGLAATI